MSMDAVTTGIDALVKRLQELGPKMEKKAIKKVLNTAAKLPLKESRGIMVRETGLKKSAINIKGFSSSGQFTVVISGDRRFKKNKDGKRVQGQGSLVHFFEHGTKTRHTKSGANRGRIKPVRFLTRGFDIKRREALTKLNNGLVAKIEELF